MKIKYRKQKLGEDVKKIGNSLRKLHYMMPITIVVLGYTGIVHTGVAAESNGSYQLLGQFKGIGNIGDSMVGPGETIYSQKFYIIQNLYPNKFDLVTIDPVKNYTAKVYPSPLSTDFYAYGMTVGPDNNIYLGTSSSTYSHIMKFDTASTQLTTVATVPIDNESKEVQFHIWGLTLSPYDNKIYGCTYPSADLISFNTTNGQIQNLGTVDSTNHYARSCVADPDPASPYIYIGTGSVEPKLVAYNIQTGLKTVLASDSGSGFGGVWVGSDGNVYGEYSNSSQFYVITNDTARPVTTVKYELPKNVFSDGDTININGNFSSVIVTHPNDTINTYPYNYDGGPLSISRLVAGSDGNIYIGSTLPFYLARISPINSEAGFTNLGKFGPGEPYSMLSYNGKLAIGTYGNAISSLMIYNLTLPVSKDTNGNPSCSGTPNPQNPQCTPTITNLTGGGPGDLRYLPIIATPDGNLYTGSIGHYGQLNGPIIKWDTQTSSAEAYYPYANLGISSLTVANNCKEVTNDYCIVGGTTIFGGDGSTPTATNAELFVWVHDVLENNIIIPNVTDVITITDLITHPANNYVYGMAINKSGSYLFIYDPATETFINGGTKLPFILGNYNSFGNYNSVAVGSDNNIWGLATDGIFTISPAGDAQLISTSPEPITAGFELVKGSNGDKIYFGSKANLYRYTVAPKGSSISGINFNDINGNGIKESGEYGLAGWIIILKDSNGNIVATNTTDINGRYTFVNLTANTYTVGEVLWPGWIQTAPTGGTYSVSLSAGENIKDKDFGNIKKGKKK